ncbi:MAG: DUF2157 domain-containing protein [Bacteroidota bacterium]
MLEQVQDWQAQGLVDEATAERLRTYYEGQKQGPAYNLAFLLAGIIGAVLIGGGIIMILAYNWENMSRPLRTVVSFIPLLLAQALYGYTYFQRANSNTWIESTSVFLMLCLASTIALISQTYNIEGSMEGFLLSWMLLSLPLLYLMNARLVGLFYLFGICSWAANASPRTGLDPVFYWLLLLAAIPFIYRNLRIGANDIAGRLLSWSLVLSVLFAYFFVVDGGNGQYSFFGIIVLFTFFYLIGEYFDGKDRLFTAFQIIPWIGLFGMGIGLGSEWPSTSKGFQEIFYEDDQTVWAAWGNLGVLLLLIASAAYLLSQQLRQRASVNWFVVLFPVLFFIGAVIASLIDPTISIILANLYLLGFGIYYLQSGIRSRNMRAVNLGMLFIGALILVRFFDTDWTFIVKGVLFVLLGMAFLGVNVLLNRKLKEAELP